MKKILRLAILLFLITNGVSGQYTPLEVGTSVPEERPFRFATFYDNQLINGLRYLNFGKNNSTYNCSEIAYFHVGDNSLNNYMSIGFYGQVIESRVFLNAAGRMGLGTNNPQSKLDVRGNISLDRNRFIYFGLEGQTGEYINEYPAGTLNIFSGYQLKIKMPNDNKSMSLMPNGGNVGIGTTNPQNTLDVNGIIHAREVKVDLTGWSDFVFLPSYKLNPLTEVEKFIKANGHLQDIPSVAEVEQNGVNVGEMQTKLLQKVEELTLYVIEQNKKIELQGEKIRDLQNKLDSKD